MRYVGQEVPAPIAVVADDRDALLEALGHGVELPGELVQLGRCGRHLVHRDAAGQVAIGDPPGGLGEAPQRGREAAGQDGGHDHRHPQREQANGDEESGHVGDRRRPEGERIGQGHLDGVREQPRGEGVVLRVGDALLGLARLWLAEVHGGEVAATGLHERAAVVQPDADPDVGSGQLVGDELHAAAEIPGDGRVQCQVVEDEGLDAGVVQVLDQAGDGLRAVLEVGGLLLDEVVLHPVQDQHTDQHQGQGQDAQEATSQAGLERAWRQRANDTPGRR